MIADEIDVPGPAKVVPWRQALDWTFGISFGLWAAEGLLFLPIAWWWRVRAPTSILILLNGLNLFLAKCAVRAWLRRSGRTWEGMPTVEIWARGRGTPTAEATGESVEVRASPGLGLGLGLLSWALAAFFGVRLLRRPEPGRMDDLDWMALLAIACLILAGTWLLATVGLRIGPVRADDEGVRAYPLGLSVRRRFVPWSAVGGVEVRRSTDASGRSIAAFPTLLGHRGERLIRVDLALVPPDDQRRLVDFLLARFPRPAKVAPGDFA